MRRFSFYHRETGAVHAQTFATDAPPKRLPDVLAANTPADHVAIEGLLDRFSQRVDLTGEMPVIIGWQPPQPSADHEWSAEAKRWQLRPDVAQRQAQRAAALAQITALEASQGRAVREAALGQPGAVERLRAIDAEITALRAKF